MTDSAFDPGADGRLSTCPFERTVAFEAAFFDAVYGSSSLDAPGASSHVEASGAPDAPRGGDG